MNTPSVVVERHEPQAAKPSTALQVGAMLLPLLKCAVCPACLSIFGGLFAGARIGLLGSTQLHGAIFVAALFADFLVLWAAWKHHQNRGPLFMCVAGAILALLGHLYAEPLELIGLALLMVAAWGNVVLLRRHRSQGGACCAHGTHHVDPSAR